jgi:hypothetical protein
MLCLLSATAQKNLPELSVGFPHAIHGFGRAGSPNCRQSFSGRKPFGPFAQTSGTMKSSIPRLPLSWNLSSRRSSLSEPQPVRDVEQM